MFSAMLERVWVEGGRRNGFAAALSRLRSFWRAHGARLASGNEELAFQALLARGLRPDHRCVELGCGGLKLASRLIAYLNEGNYVGLDAADTFTGNMDGALVAAKRPFLARMEPSLILAATADPPERIICAAALEPIGAEELDGIARTLCRLVGPRTNGWFLFAQGTQPQLVLDRFQALRSDLRYVLSEEPSGREGAGFGLLSVLGRDLPALQAETPVVSSLEAHRRRAQGHG